MKLSDMIPLDKEIKRARQANPEFRKIWDATEFHASLTGGSPSRFRGAARRSGVRRASAAASLARAQAFPSSVTAMPAAASIAVMSSRTSGLGCCVIHRRYDRRVSGRPGQWRARLVSTAEGISEDRGPAAPNASNILPLPFRQGWHTRPNVKRDSAAPQRLQIRVDLAAAMAPPGFSLRDGRCSTVTSAWLRPTPRTP